MTDKINITIDREVAERRANSYTHTPVVLPDDDLVCDDSEAINAACREALTNPPTETPLLSIEGAALDAKLVELHDVAESIQILAEGIVDSTALSQTPEAEPKDAPPWLPVLNATLSILEGPKAGWNRLEGFSFEGIKEDLNRRLDPRFVEDQPTNHPSPEDEVRLTGKLRHEAYGDFINAGNFDLQAQDECLREIPNGPVELIVRPLPAPPTEGSES